MLLLPLTHSPLSGTLPQMQKKYSGDFCQIIKFKNVLLPLNRLQFFLGVSPPKPTLSRNKIFIFVFRPEGCKRREHTESVRICGGRGKSSDRRNERLVRPLRRLEEQRSGKLSPVISACHSRQDVLKLSPSNC